jgi:hypothetical protein
MSTTSSTTRQPMCSGGKIQLPKINNNGTDISLMKDKDDGSIKFNYINTEISINGNIKENDLCYNRCPNGEAPQVDKHNGQYFCLVPALVTYQVKQGELNNQDNKSTQDSIDFSQPYTVSCQSTDLMEPNQVQNIDNKNIMFGTPISIKSGLYESPVPPGALRSSNYNPGGDFKWFCKRPMYGAPPLGVL